VSAADPQAPRIDARRVSTKEQRRLEAGVVSFVEVDRLRLEWITQAPPSPPPPPPRELVN
jgi:hypothetical protein